MCSGTFSTDCDSNFSWIDEYDSENIASLHLHDDLTRPGCPTAPEDTSHNATECFDEHGHALTWNDGELWCRVCATTISWPFWPENPSQACRSLVAPAPDVPPDDPAIICGSGDGLQRKGIGLEHHPVRPGFQAGGTAGPWWTRTEPQFFGN